MEVYSKATVKLLKGVVEKDDTVWNDIINYQNDIQNFLRVLGLELIIKKDDGFAFVKQSKMDDGKTLNLVNRRQYGFEVSVLLIVLRQMLEDFDCNPTDSQTEDKYITVTELKEQAELFFPPRYDTAKFERALEGNIEKIANLGILVKPKNYDGDQRYKIHRIIKEKITLDDLLDFKKQLKNYGMSDESI